MFAGQGAQVVGMGKDFAEQFPAARRWFDRANAALGYDLASVCFNGPEAELIKTENAQPGIFLVSWIAFELLKERVPGLKFEATAGLSLGEFTALGAAGVMTFDDAIRVVRQRGRFMQEACDATRGGMAAIIGLDEAATRERDPLELRREVGLVPQLPALLEGTVEDNIRFAAELAGREPDVVRLLDFAGLDASFAERDPAKLSVGEQQRVMLARSLALEPRVLLLDEPTSALDATARDAVEATLRDLRARLDLSTVLVTHDVEQAKRMSEWVVRIEEGRTVAEGPTGEILG